jgi:hypothetical protein
MQLPSELRGGGHFEAHDIGSQVTDTQFFASSPFGVEYRGLVDHQVGGGQLSFAS